MLEKEHTLATGSRGAQWKWALPILAVFLPVILLSVYSFSVASNSVRTLVEEENLSAAGNLSQVLTQDIRQNVKLAHAVASIPGTITAVRNQDEVAMGTRLKAIMVSNPDLHRAFVVGTGGVLWSEFPKADGAYGSFYGDRSWFYSVQKDLTPFVSGLYIRPQFPDEPVVAIAVPVQDRGTLLGVLVFEYRVQHLSTWLQNVRLGLTGHMLLVDQHGSLVAHPTVPVGGALFKQYMGIEVIERSHNGELYTTTYTDPVTHQEMIATFVPIAMGKSVWVAVAQQPTAEAFSLLNQVKQNLSIVGVILTIFTLLMVVIIGRMSANMVRLNEELEEKNQALKDFTSIVSHQLKAPITAMRWNIEMILDGDFGAISPELRTVIQGLHTVNISNYQLVMDILNVSRLDRGVVALKTGSVSIGDIINRSTRDYIAAAEHAGLTLTVEHEDEQVKVNVDMEKVAESITNSLSNAIKYTKQGGIHIKTYAKNAMMVIEVADTGPGMPPEMLSNLFSRSGVKKANTGAENSSGLGLYIAKQFMQMHGGDVTVSSELGKGTTFTYTLPLSD